MESYVIDSYSHSWAFTEQQRTDCPDFRLQSGNKSLKKKIKQCQRPDSFHIFSIYKYKVWNNNSKGKAFLDYGGDLKTEKGSSGIMAVP